MIEWRTTQPNLRSPATGHDAGQRGWKLHAVMNIGGLETIKYQRALCGLRPRHGWGLDAFIEDKCVHCQLKVEKTQGTLL